METPSLLIFTGGAGILLGIILGLVGLRFHKKLLIGGGAALFLLAAALVLWCPVCVTCGGKTTQGMEWGGVCCVRSWRSTRQILWWELVTQPGEWK